MRSRARLVAALAVASSFLALPLPAQFAQYTAPGALAAGPENARKALEKAVEEARWKLGPLRVEPVLGLSDLAYVDNARGATGDGSGTDGDLTATVTAGLRGYLPVGSRSTLALFALPDYVWWQDQTELRRFNQRFGAGLFTYFNRLGIEIKAQRLEDLDFVTTQLARRAASRTDSLAADLEIPIGSRISLVGGGAVARSEHNLDGEPSDALFEQLNRESRDWHAGLRWYLTSTLSLTGAWGHSETAFRGDAENRDNAGEVVSAGLAWNRPKLGVTLSTERSKLEPEPGSTFAGFDGSTWSGAVRWSPRERFGLSLYGQKRLAYALGTTDSLYADERVGASVSFGIGWRLRLELFGEQGTLDYGVEEGSLSSRQDDLTAYGGRLGVPLGRRFTFSAGARWTTVDSELPGAGYELTEILATLGLGLSASGTWF